MEHLGAKTWRFHRIKVGRVLVDKTCQILVEFCVRLNIFSLADLICLNIFLSTLGMFLSISKEFEPICMSSFFFIETPWGLDRPSNRRQMLQTDSKIG